MDPVSSHCSTSNVAKDDHKSQNIGPRPSHCWLFIFLPLLHHNLQDVLPAALLRPHLQLSRLRQPLQPYPWLDAWCRHYVFHPGKNVNFENNLHINSCPFKD